MALQSTFLARCTTRLVGLSASGSETSYGTGFFYRVGVSETQSICVVVTNKHVVQGCTAIRLIASTAPAGVDADLPQPRGTILQTTIDIPCQAPWLVPHPVADVDLCALVCTPQLTALLGPGRQPFMSFVSRDLHLTDDERQLVRFIEQVTMVGYPNGLWDHVNDAPLIRQGCTATHPFQDFQGRPEFVIDMTCLPGSSGSPVFLYEEGVFRSSRTDYSPGSRLAFLGVLWGGPTMDVAGRIEAKPIPHSKTEQVPVISSMMGLGYVIHATQVDVLAAAVLSTWLPLASAAAAPVRPPAA